MSEPIFEFRSYKSYLKAWMASAPKRGRGCQSTLAGAAQCQSAYVSQVLHGDRHFNLEQAEGINGLLSHSEDEAQYFLLLVMLERAGTNALRKRLESKIQAYIQRYKNLKDRLKIKESLPAEIQAQYYGSWTYAAVHIATTIPELRTKEAIARALGLDLMAVTRNLEFLESAGLIARIGDDYVPGVQTTFVGKESTFLLHHNTNWRHRAIESIQRNLPEDIHYSSVISISAEDAEKIRFLVLKAIEDVRKIRVPSREEQLHSFCMDLFRLA